MAENVPEFKYFPHDRKQLLNTLARFDDGMRVEDVVGPEIEAYKIRQHSNTLLLQVLLEFMCYELVKDENQREILLIEVCRRLSKRKVLNDTLIVDKNNPLRKAMKENVIEFFRKVCEDVIPTAELNATAVSLLQNDCISANLQHYYCVNFDELCQIGKGGFGYVYKAQYKLTKVIYAIKKIPFVYKTDTYFLKVMREANNFAALSHSNVVRYHSAWIEIEKSDAVNKSPSHANFVPEIQDITKHNKIVIKQTSSSSGSLRAENFEKDPNKFSESESDSIIFSEYVEIPKDVNLSDENCSRNSFNNLYDNDCSESYSNTNHKFIEGDSKGLESESDSIIFSESAEITKNANWSAGNYNHSFLNHSDEDDETIEEDSDEDNSSDKNNYPEDNRNNSPSNLKIHGTLYIQMEYCDCDLSFWLFKRAETKGKELPFEMDIDEIFLNIVKGVNHIHSKNIIHRDLKPHNIFYSKQHKTVKIGDFGLATLAGYTDSSSYKSHKHSTSVGTIPYSAPEQMKSKTYDTKVDIYSLGIILIELINVCTTRTELYRIIDAIKNGQIIEGMKKFPLLGKLAIDLINDNPKKRMSAKEVLNLIDKDAKAILKEVVFSDFVADIKKKDGKIKDLNESVQNLQVTVLDLKSEVKKRDDKIKDLNESVQNMQVTVLDLKSEVKKRDDKIKDLNESVQNMQVTILELKSELSRLSKTVSE